MPSLQHSLLPQASIHILHISRGAQELLAAVDLLLSRHRDLIKRSQRLLEVVVITNMINKHNAIDLRPFLLQSD